MKSVTQHKIADDKLNLAYWAYAAGAGKTISDIAQSSTLGVGEWNEAMSFFARHDRRVAEKYMPEEAICPTCMKQGCRHEKRCSGCDVRFFGEGDFCSVNCEDRDRWPEDFGLADD